GGPGQRRADADAGERNALAARGRLLQARTILGKTLDQAVDQIVRTGVRNRLHQRRHVDHGVALDRAELEVIEIRELHVDLPLIVVQLRHRRPFRGNAAMRLSPIVPPGSRLPVYASGTTAMALISMR